MSNVTLAILAPYCLPPNVVKRAAELLSFDRRMLHRKLDEYRTEDPNFEV